MIIEWYSITENYLQNSLKRLLQKVLKSVILNMMSGDMGVCTFLFLLLILDTTL